MLISVIVPTKHRNEQLAKCLDQLAPGKQTLDASNYEVIVTDDGVETSAEAMIRERYRWARWIAGPRRGPAANRNHGVRFARGQWLAFTDDDCVPEEKWLAGFAVELDSADILEGRTLCQSGVNSPLLEAPVNLTGGNLWSCNLLVRRSAFEKLIGFDEDFRFPGCEDLEFATRARRAGLRIRFVPAATIDHPPRLRATGWRAGLKWESRVLCWYKEANTDAVWTWLPLHVLKERISQLLRYPIRLHTAHAAASLIGELACVVLHLPSWEVRYRPIARKAAGNAPRTASC